ncbi:MAG TPA: IS1595 family transposase, partial [Nitrosomonas europaea]|nr:IS1595 family transposase [Nitrosomonas europaea]
MKASDFLEWVGKITQLSRVQKEQTKHRLGGMVPRIKV